MKRKNIMQKLGKNLRRIREAKGLTQGDIYRKLGMDRGYISGIENGHRNPTLLNIEKLAKVLDVTVDELLK